MYGDNMNMFISIVFAIIGIAGIFAILYIVIYNKIQVLNIRVNEAETIIDEELRKKYDLILQSEKIIKKTTKKEITLFQELKDLKNENISTFDFERKCSEGYNLIKQIKCDYESLEKNDDFNNIINSILDCNEKLEAAKSFYNKYTSKLNEVIRKFPSNIIALIHKVKAKTYFDGKDMFDDEIDDFKI